MFFRPRKSNLSKSVFHPQLLVKDEKESDVYLIAKRRTKDTNFTFISYNTEQIHTQTIQRIGNKEIKLLDKNWHSVKSVHTK